MAVVRTHKKQFVQISNDVAQRSPLSWEGLGFLTYCLSMPETWEFKPKLLANLRNAGRTKTYRLFEELIKNFHCIRVYKPYGNLRKQIEYEVYDDPTTCKERIEELKKDGRDYESGYELGEGLKKSFRRSTFQDTGGQDAENADIYKDTDNLDRHKQLSFSQAAEVIKQKQTAAKAASPIGEELASFFIAKIKENKPDFMPQNPTRWAKDIDDILLKDKRDPERVRKVIAWAQGSSFWKANILSPAKLRKQFDQLEIKMNEESSPQAKKTAGSAKEKNYAKVSVHFKNESNYNGAICFINQESISFLRGMTQITVKFSELGFDDQFDSMLRKFGVKNPLRQ